MSLTQITDPLSNAVRLGFAHGYRIDGDILQLNAELALPVTGLADGTWALQLWACDAPHRGGPLRGIKVGETALRSLERSADGGAIVAGHSFANVPVEARDYAMVLVLAASDGESVVDFANYPHTQRFVVPYLRGHVTLERYEGELTLRAECIANPRSEENLSGSLRLELHALSAPYDSQAETGRVLASLDLGVLSGQGAMWDSALRVELSIIPNQTNALALVLREWSEAGYVTRDYRSVPYQAEDRAVITAAKAAIADAAKSNQPAPAAAAKAESTPAVAPKPEPVVAAKPAESTAPVVAAKPEAVIAAKPVEAASTVAKTAAVPAPSGEKADPTSAVRLAK
jgi:hypothetical protein